MLIYFISCLHAILFVLKHFWLALVVSREILIRTFVRSLLMHRFCLWNVYVVIIAAAAVFFGLLLHPEFTWCFMVVPSFDLFVLFLVVVYYFPCNSSLHFASPFTPTSCGRWKIFRAYKSMAFQTKKERKRLGLLVLCAALKPCKRYMNYGKKCNTSFYQARLTSWLSRAREYHPFCSYTSSASSLLSSFLLLIFFPSLLLAIFFLVPRTMSFSLFAFVPPSFNLFCYCDNFFPFSRSVFSLRFL